MGPTSFADLLMFEDVVYRSYRAACVARGLLADNGEHHICLRGAAQIQTGDQLHQLFVFMLIHATVANPPALLDRHFASLSDDARYHIERYEDMPINDETIRMWRLNKIRLLLAANDRTFAFFDLPKLTDDRVRLFDCLEERLPRFDRQQCAQDGEAARARLNHDQQIAFDEFLRAVELDVVDQMRNNNLGPQCLRGAAQIQTGDQLHQLFVFMLIHATVASPPALLDRHFASRSDDARYHIERYEDVPVNDETICMWTLNKIRLLLAANDRTLAFFDLPELTDDGVRLFDRLEEWLPRFDRQQCAQDGEAARARLNHNQQIAFDEFLRVVELDVVDQMRNNNLGPQHVFFLLAPGGTGKTFVENALLDTVQARGDQAIAVASSGVAALLLKGGHMAHSTFRIPLDTLPTSTCLVDRESDLALLLRSTKLIIWDEAPMAHRFAVEAVDRLLRDLRETEELFGGVTTIFAGDFRQCLPVVPKGTPGQIVDASLIKADFWRDVRILRLTENMRLSSNADATDEAQLARTRDFAEWLLTVGGGTANMHPYNKIALPDYLLLLDGQRTAEGLINFVYPGLRTVNKESVEDLIQLFSRQAILAPHNATLDRINAKLLKEFDGDYIDYRSAGKTGGEMGPELISPEYLH